MLSGVIYGIQLHIVGIYICYTLLRHSCMARCDDSLSGIYVLKSRATFLTHFFTHLCMDLSSLAKALDVDEVVGAPLRPEVVELPLLEDVEKGQVVALRHEELLPGRVRLFLSILTCWSMGVVVKRVD